MVDAEIYVEGMQIFVLGNCPPIGDISVLDSRLRKKDITKEMASVGGQKAVQEPANWNGEKRVANKRRNSNSGKLNQQEASFTMVFSSMG